MPLTDPPTLSFLSDRLLYMEAGAQTAVPGGERASSTWEFTYTEVKHILPSRLTVPTYL